MSVVSHWLNDQKQIVMSEFSDDYTWSDFYRAVHNMHQMMMSVDQRVDLILCYHADLQPGSPLVHFRKAFQEQPANTGKIVIVNTVMNRAAKAFMKSLSAVIQKIFPNKSHVMFADSLDEALSILDAGRIAA